MPLKDYVCQNEKCEARGKAQERLRRLSDREAEACDLCRQPMTEVNDIGPTSFSLKGGGWFASGGYAMLVALLYTGACVTPGAAPAPAPAANPKAETTAYVDGAAPDVPQPGQGSVEATRDEVVLSGIWDETTLVLGRGREGTGIVGVLQPVGQADCHVGAFFEGERALEARAVRLESDEADMIAYVFDSLGLLDLMAAERLEHRCGKRTFRFTEAQLAALRSFAAQSLIFIPSTQEL